VAQPELFAGHLPPPRRTHAPPPRHPQLGRGRRTPPASPETAHPRQHRHPRLNVADPLVTGAYGKASFDAVGPLLLIGWAEVAPGLLQAITNITSPASTAFDAEALARRLQGLT
jgi:hypothetical protein